MSVEIIFETGSWPSEAGLWAEQAEATLLETLQRDGAKEIAILLSDDVRIQDLNRKYRGKDKPTNILSWPTVEYEGENGETPRALSEDEECLGDLALAYETCVMEAKNIGLEQHFKHLIVHGILHLLGYDHENEADAFLMETLEIAILERLDIPNPYEDRENE